jgi:hypothetical protein
MTHQTAAEIQNESISYSSHEKKESFLIIKVYNAIEIHDCRMMISATKCHMCTHAYLHDRSLSSIVIRCRNERD